MLIYFTSCSNTCDAYFFFFCVCVCEREYQAMKTIFVIGPAFTRRQITQRSLEQQHTFWLERINNLMFRTFTKFRKTGFMLLKSYSIKDIFHLKVEMECPKGNPKWNEITEVIVVIFMLDCVWKHQFRSKCSKLLREKTF